MAVPKHREMAREKRKLLTRTGDLGLSESNPKDFHKRLPGASLSLLERHEPAVLVPDGKETARAT